MGVRSFRLGSHRWAGHPGVRSGEALTAGDRAADRPRNDVLDDGVGIPDEVGRSGLRNLEDRARECGGRLSVHRVEPSGTRLAWRVPLSHRV